MRPWRLHIPRAPGYPRVISRSHDSVKLLLTISGLNILHPICLASHDESVVTEDEPDIVLFVIDVLSGRSAQFYNSVAFPIFAWSKGLLQNCVN